MRTTLNIDDEMFRELMRITRAKSNAEAVRTALKEYLHMKRKEKVLALRGRLEIVDCLEKLRQLEEGERCEGSHG